MPELLPNADLAPPPATSPPPEDDDGTFLMSEDMAIRLEAREIMNKRSLHGQLNAYRGEYVIAGPDGTVLGHSPRLKEAELMAAPMATAEGIPPEHLIMFYVPTLD